MPVDLSVRKKLETDPSEPQHILTAPGIGYQFKLRRETTDTK